MIKMLLSLTIMLSAQNLFADQEPPSRIIGKGIDLHFIDHGIAGKVGEGLVFGAQLTEEFGSKVMVRKNNTVVTSQFKKTGDKFVGVIQRTSRQLYKLEFVNLDKEHATLHFLLNGQPLKVAIKADDFKNNHFINPKYYISGPNNLKVSYEMRGGQACYGCSMNLVFMILAAVLA